MKRQMTVGLLVSVSLHVSHAGDNPTLLDKSLWMTGSCLVYSGFDYWGYNVSKNSRGIAPMGYRVCQLALQG